MTLIDKKMAAIITGVVGADYIEKEVKKAWEKNNKCLENLSNKNKDSLQKINLQLLKGLKYKGEDATKLFALLKSSKDITPEQKEFALFLFKEYPKHSIKAQGFE